MPHLTIDDEVAVVTLDRPDKLNALDESALEELGDATSPASTRARTTYSGSWAHGSSRCSRR